jgi:NAD(P)-dependent dehydrogenase (short-subunit alcohol dehydrogenase family)
MASECVRVAIVTGSNKGIGLAVVRGLCRQFQGHVYLTSRDEQGGAEAVAKLEAEGLAPKYHQLDITNTESIERLKQFMLEKYGGVDVLINNAGIAYKPASTAPAIEQATVTIRTNFTGTLDMMRAFVPITKSHGRIVNVSSLLGHLAKLSGQGLRDRLSDPTLTEAGIVAIMDEYISLVREGKQKEAGWGSSHYGASKAGETAMTKVFARQMAASGEL